MMKAEIHDLESAAQRWRETAEEMSGDPARESYCVGYADCCDDLARAYRAALRARQQGEGR